MLSVGRPSAAPCMSCVKVRRQSSPDERTGSTAHLRPVEPAEELEHVLTMAQKDDGGLVMRGWWCRSLESAPPNRPLSAPSFMKGGGGRGQVRSCGKLRTPRRARGTPTQVRLSAPASLKRGSGGGAARRAIATETTASAGTITTWRCARTLCELQRVTWKRPRHRRRRLTLTRLQSQLQSLPGTCHSRKRRRPSRSSALPGISSPLPDAFAPSALAWLPMLRSSALSAELPPLFRATCGTKATRRTSSPPSRHLHGSCPTTASTRGAACSGAR